MKIGTWQCAAVIISTILWCCLRPDSMLANDSSGASVGVTVPIIQSLEVNPPVFIVPEISSAHLDQGSVEALHATTLTISSNAPWQILIRSEDLDMGKVDDHIKPLADFLWRNLGDPDYAALSPDNQRVASGADYADHREIQLDYKILVGWTRDKPGTYGLTLRFTVSTLE